MNLECFLQSLPVPIAVVGNGPMKGMGEEIDSHPSVIRINNFQIEGFEGDVGKKITAWCTNCWWDVPWKDYGVPCFCPFHWSDDDCRPSRWCDLHQVKDIILPGRHWSMEVRALKAVKPSTGLILLYALNQLGILVDAYGFDGLEGGHYWDERHEHDHPGEKGALFHLTTINFRK